MKKSTLIVWMALLLIGNAGFTDEKTVSNAETPKTISDAREILPSSALALPTGSVRLSLAEIITGLGKGFELGTVFLANAVGTLNLKTSYNFWNHERFCAKASATAIHVLSSDSTKSVTISPELTVTVYATPRIHEHFNLSSDSVSSLGSLQYTRTQYTPGEGVKKWVYETRDAATASLITEIRQFKNDHYSGSGLFSIGASIPRASRSRTDYFAGASYLWAWEKFHFSLGATVHSEERPFFGSPVMPELGLYWTL